MSAPPPLLSRLVEVMFRRKNLRFLLKASYLNCSENKLVPKICKIKVFKDKIKGSDRECIGS